MRLEFEKLEKIIFRPTVLPIPEKLGRVRGNKNILKVSPIFPILCISFQMKKRKCRFQMKTAKIIAIMPAILTVQVRNMNAHNIDAAIEAIRGILARSTILILRNRVLLFSR